MEKKNKYADGCAAQHAYFIPLCFLSMVIVGFEANFFEEEMSAQWDRNHASLLCIRGSHTRWRGMGLGDVAAIDLTW